MKKFFAMLMAALMVLSLMATMVVSAAAESKSTTIIVSEGEDIASNQGDGKSEGWRNSKVTEGKPALTVQELDGQKAAAGTLTGSSEQYFNTIRFLYYTATPIDITATSLSCPASKSIRSSIFSHCLFGSLYVQPQ